MDVAKKHLIKWGLKKLASYIPPKFVKEYRKDTLEKFKNIRVNFSYSKNDETGKYKVDLGEIDCVCGEKIEEYYIGKPNRESQRKERWCNSCSKKYKLNNRDIKNEISKRIRNRYPEEIGYLAS